ncbi:MAG: hypothetical protein LBU88_03155, partial [Treponema sp.]|nr:hypothetical protein [Treponema sp.]
GNLYLWKVASSDRQDGFNITEGKNVKCIKWTENGSEQFHEYIVKGGWNNEPERVIDNTCPRGRTLTIDIDDPFIEGEKLRSRANTEMRRRREIKTVVTVPGWGLTDEQIVKLGNTNEREIYWIPNILIPVKMPSPRLDASLLISEVEYSATPESMEFKTTHIMKEMVMNSGGYTVSSLTIKNEFNKDPLTFINKRKIDYYGKKLVRYIKKKQTAIIF